MAIAIKSIPVLRGKATERFVSIADTNRNCEMTQIPGSMRVAIQQMKERSKSFCIKHPQNKTH